MKKYFLSVIILCVFFVASCSKVNQRNELSSDVVYFFYSESCPHCHEAQKHIAQAYPNLKMERVDVATSDGYALFVKCAQKFNLGNMIGTPLFCMGDNHLMGWGPGFDKAFDKYVQPFLNKD